jgi:transcriptional regulator with XRE-family HTH domain
VVNIVDVGMLIKEARLAKGLTQEQLGKLVGVQKSAIAKYESGRVVNIKRGTLQGLAKALDLKGSDLIIQANPKEAAELSARVLIDSDLRETVELYSVLSEENKRIVKDLIRSLAK